MHPGGWVPTLDEATQYYELKKYVFTPARRGDEPVVDFFVVQQRYQTLDADHHARFVKLLERDAKFRPAFDVGRPARGVLSQGGADWDVVARSREYHQSIQNSKSRSCQPNRCDCGNARKQKETSMTALNTMTTIMKAMNAAEAKTCLDELLGVYNEAGNASRKLKLVLDDEGKKYPARNYRRRGGRAKICALFPICWQPDLYERCRWRQRLVNTDFSDRKLDHCGCGKTRSSERFVGIVHPGKTTPFAAWIWQESMLFTQPKTIKTFSRSYRPV